MFPCRPTSRNSPGRARLRLERLEELSLLAPLGPTLTFAEAEPNDTLDRAGDLGTLTPAAVVRVDGSIGGAEFRPTDVDFYTFRLDAAAIVRLTASAPSEGGSPPGVLTLYNTDPTERIGHRLIAQSTDGRILQGLAPGSYFVAASGLGNLHFHPFVANSGYPGRIGAYQLTITAAPGTANGLSVLASDPVPGAVLANSPFVLRVMLSSPPDDTTLVPGSTVRLLASPTATFANPTDVELASINFNPDTSELVVLPAAPLGAGFYRLSLAGDWESHPGGAILTPDGIPLGGDVAIDFRVAGGEGDDTPDTARELGELPAGELVQLTGMIGDDPTAPVPFDPSDMDLYHFHVTTTGRYALTAEVFAGRVGSSLDPALSLFRRAADGTLEFVASNFGTSNPTLATNGDLPLLTDALLSAALSEGDYYLAVSSGFNAPDPAGGLPVGENGVFDPAVAHSGQAGNSIGHYVLNLQLQRASESPTVVSVTPGTGATLGGPPTHLTVRFSGPVNVARLAFEAYAHAFSGRISSVFLRAADGTEYFPRLESFDAGTQTATFLMIDALPPGAYELHLSGPQGLTDPAGSPLVGNDPSGDYVARFTVAGPARGTPGKPTAWLAEPGNDTPDSPQVLGTLFPLELQAGVTVTRTLGGTIPPTDTADYYQVQITQAKTYSLALADTAGLPNGAVTRIWKDGVEQAVLPQGVGAVFVDLEPGTYVLGVEWPDADPAAVAYRLTVSLLSDLEPAPPLTTGPAPAIQVRLATDPPPTNPGTSPATGGLPSKSTGTAPTTGPVPDPTPAPAAGGLPSKATGTAPTTGPVPDPTPAPASGPTNKPARSANLLPVGDGPVGGRGDELRTSAVSLRLDPSGIPPGSIQELVALVTTGTVYLGAGEGSEPTQTETAPAPRSTETAAGVQPAPAAPPPHASVPPVSADGPPVQVGSYSVSVEVAAPEVPVSAVATPAAEPAPQAEAVGWFQWAVVGALTLTLGFVCGRKWVRAAGGRIRVALVSLNGSSELGPVAVTGGGGRV